LAAAPSNDTGAPVPLRGRFVELIAGIQLSHQPVVFRRATLFALWFGIAGHVFLPLLAIIYNIDFSVQGRRIDAETG
jgi:hypothetical protein